MRKSRQFWQDIDLAIGILMLRKRLHHIITEGRNTRQSLSEINKDMPTIPGRDRVLYRYYEVMKARFHYYNGHMLNLGR